MNKGFIGVALVLASILLASPVCAQLNVDIENYVKQCRKSIDPDAVIRSCSLAIESEQRYGRRAEELVEWFKNRGIAYAGKGDLDLAIQDFYRTIQLDPQNAEAYFNRGVAYHKMCSYTQAIQDYDQVLSLKPNLHRALHNRDLAFRQGGGEPLVCFLMRIKGK